MARNFGEYDPEIDLGVTWPESMEMLDEDGEPVDLTGYDVVAELYAEIPERDPDTGLATAEPVLQVTTVDYHDAAPAWPVSEGASIPTPTNGIVVLNVDVDDVWLLSPANERRRLYWGVILVNSGTGERIPLVRGIASCVPTHVVTP